MIKILGLPLKLLGLPFLASVHGADVDNLILYMHWVMGILFAGWLFYFFFVLIRFRKSKNPKASYTGVTSHASSWIEGAVIIAEAVLLIGSAIPLWARVADKFPAEKDATVIRVIAAQFSWNSRYPGADGVFGKQDLKFISGTNTFGVDPSDPAGKDDFSGTTGEMYVPVNKPVIAYVSSQDVIHSFKINPLRITQDAIPGLSIPIWFKPTHEGVYLINCAQLCGNSHYYMKGTFNVVSEQKYKEWFAATAAKNKAGGAATGGFE